MSLSFIGIQRTLSLKSLPYQVQHSHMDQTRKTLLEKKKKKNKPIFLNDILHFTLLVALTNIWGKHFSIHVGSPLCLQFAHFQTLQFRVSSFHSLREAEHRDREAAGEQAPPFMKERQQGKGQKEAREKLRCSPLEPAHRDLGTLRLDIPSHFRVQIFLKQPPHGVQQYSHETE